MDTIQLKSKNDGYYMSVIDDCIVSASTLYVPVVTVSEDQLGIFGNTIMPMETLLENYYFPRNKTYGMADFLEKNFPSHFNAMEYYGEVDDPAIDAVLENM